MTDIRPSKHGVRPSFVVLPPGSWRTILEFLQARFPAVSREQWCARIARGEATHENGEPVTADTAFVPQQRIYYYRSIENEPRIPFEARVIFQDEYIVVADKPHFLPVVPGGRFVRETLLARLTESLGIETLAPMHRIDRDTAGLVLFTVQPRTRDAYQRLFRERSVEKHYEAIAPFRADLTLPLTRKSRLVESATFMQMHEIDGAPNAQTQIDLGEQYGEFARYALRPLTGQKHQLRAHMSALGIPICNDPIYPTLLPAAPLDDLSRPLKLLAKQIAFTDPLTGESRVYESAQSLNWDL